MQILRGDGPVQRRHAHLILVLATVIFSAFFYIAGIMFFTWAPILPGDVFSAYQSAPGRNAIHNSVSRLERKLTPVPKSRGGKPGSIDAALDALERAIQELRFFASPWPILGSNLTAILLTTLLIPSLFVVLSKKTRRQKDKRRYLLAALLLVPLMISGAFGFLVGFFSAEVHLKNGFYPWYVFKHGIPELGAGLLAAGVLLHGFFLHRSDLGSEEGVTRIQSAFYPLLRRNVPTYILVVAMLTLAAFIEAGRIF